VLGGVPAAPAQPQRPALLVEDGRHDVGVARRPEQFLLVVAAALVDMIDISI